MTYAAPPPSFLARLRQAGVTQGDDDEQRLSKSLLVLATGLVSLASVLWLLLYWHLGLRLSVTLPFLFQLLLSLNLASYIRTGNFAVFRISQLGLFLVFPFAAQWSIGNVIAASGVILWGLLAPVGAMLCIGVRASLPWLLAYLGLTALTGTLDYHFADLAEAAGSQGIPMRTSVVFFALNFATVSTIVYLLLGYAVREKHRAQAQLQEAHRLLMEAQVQSEQLLLNVLPGPVAERLKAGDVSIADRYPEVVVMFADIVNFTRLAAGMSADRVFSMLNAVFSRFDQLAQEFGVEKIKTIGDAYMVASGLPACQAEHPHAAMAELALAMREAIQEIGKTEDLPLDLRIGIASGPVVAGVVGQRKFIYDLWGDTVNVASRLSTEGGAGMIQCDGPTHAALASVYRFDTPAVLYLKGKGAFPVFRLLARLPAVPDETSDNARSAA
ncbi:MAG: adenylate/guanylate cyclase domain-containing protein [Zoogloea sp.]|nr:adenylate/guanylate cyclase domain-containing protein [Zoogloea sp.]